MHQWISQNSTAPTIASAQHVRVLFCRAMRMIQDPRTRRIFGLLTLRSDEPRKDDHIVMNGIASCPSKAAALPIVRLLLLVSYLGLVWRCQGLVVHETLPQICRSVPSGNDAQRVGEGQRRHRTFLSPSTATFSSLRDSTQFWLAATNDSSKIDRVVRVLDDGSVKLKDSGVVSLEGVKIPKNQGFPACLSVTPTSKLSQLLPAKTAVRVEEQSSSKSVVLTRDSDRVVVNDRIVELGYGRASSKAKISLKSLEASARESKRGIFQSCDDAFQAKFDPLQAPLERPIPRNPGDRVGCSDFSVYEDALKHYETYFDLYGDVARLDRNGDGIPCPSLPHTLNSERYRIKKPTR